MAQSRCGLRAATTYAHASALSISPSTCLDAGQGPHSGLRNFYPYYVLQYRLAQLKSSDMRHTDLRAGNASRIGEHRSISVAHFDVLSMGRPLIAEGIVPSTKTPPNISTWGAGWISLYSLTGGRRADMLTVQTRHSKDVVAWVNASRFPTHELETVVIEGFAL